MRRNSSFFACLMGVYLCACSIVVSERARKTDSNFRPGATTESGAAGTISTPADLTDDDNTSTGFGGGTKVGVQWNSNSNNKLILGPDTDCDGNMNEGETAYTNCAELDASWTPQWSSLVSYWKFNEASWNGTANEVVDSKGTNHGTAKGNANTTSNSKIGPFAAAGLNTAGDTIELGNSTTLQPSNLSISLWVKRTASWNGGHNATFIWAKANATWNGLGYYFSAESSSGNRAMYFQGDNDRGATVAIAPNTFYPLNEWVHIAMTFNTVGDIVKMYRNGISQTVVAHRDGIPQSITSTSDLKEIGTNSPGYGDLPIKGSIDDMAIWSTALSESEIQLIYSRQSAKYSGQFTSRVMDYGSSILWDGIKWLTTLPFGKELTGDANNSGTITSADSESSADYPSLVGSTGSTTDDNLMSGLLGLWRFNETSLNSAPAGADFADFSGSGKHLTESGSASIRNFAAFASGVEFDGTNDVLSVASADHYNVQNLSICFWVYPNYSQSAAITTIIDYQHTGDYKNWVIQSENATGAKQYYFAYANGSSYDYSNAEGIVFNDSQWNHACYVKSSGTITGYLNGNQSYQRSNADPTIAYSVNPTLSIGGRLADRYFRGSIDEVAIWNRALHADEVKQLYRRGANRIKFQVRTCTSSDCSDNPTWLGSDNTKASYFSELHNYAPYNYDTNNCSATNLILTGSPSLVFSCFTGALSNLSTQQYFQYRAVLESDDTSSNCNYGNGATWCSPELRSVTVAP